jgi:hypothetical protein
MLIASFNLSDSFGILIFSFLASVVLTPIGAITGALRARSFGLGVLALLAGVIGGSLTFLGAGFLVKELLPRSGTPDFLQFLLTAQIALSTFAGAWLAASLVSKNFGTPKNLNESRPRE